MENNNYKEISFDLEQVKTSLIAKYNILELFRALKTKDDFLELLNVILSMESEKSSKKKFTKRQLDYFLASLAENDDSNRVSIFKEIYYSFEIKKKSGEARIINAPDHALALYLHCIDVLIKKI